MHDVPLWLYFVGFLLVLGPLVFVHEYGHYIVGRWCGVKADAFSIGFGRRIVGWTDKRGTEWKIGWLPLGGYVQFAGDRDAVSQPDAGWQTLPTEERSHTFPAQPVWKRALIVLAGPLTNLLFAILVFAGFFMAYGAPALPPVIGGVQAGSAAEAAGLRVGDRIVRIDGQAIESFDAIPNMVAYDLGRPAVIEVDGLVIDPGQLQAFVDGRPVGFTPREFEVLYALARAEGKPIPRERVYREVWGYEMMRGDRSVDVFVRKVRQKLSSARPDRSYVQTHYGVGYRFEG